MSKIILSISGVYTVLLLVLYIVLENLYQLGDTGVLVVIYGISIFVAPLVVAVLYLVHLILLISRRGLKIKMKIKILAYISIVFLLNFGIIGFLWVFSLSYFTI